MTREYTNQLLEMIDNEIIDRDYVIMACVKYMSEDDVREMMEINEIVPSFYEDYEGDDDFALEEEF